MIVFNQANQAASIEYFIQGMVLIGPIGICIMFQEDLKAYEKQEIAVCHFDGQLGFFHEFMGIRWWGRGG